MEKAHSAINWENHPSIDTPLNKTNLNKMDSAVGIIDDRVIALDTSKATKTEVANALVDVSMDSASGIFTFTRKNGAKVTIDTKLEKLAVNFRYDSTNQRLVITLDNGETQYVDVSALVTQYEFLESDAIAWEVTNGAVRPYIKGGSITDSMIEANYLANITVQANTAVSASQSALESQSLAEQSAKEAEQYMYDWKGSLLPQGKISFSQIPTSGVREGYLYDINEAFVSDERFADGAGFSYPAGTNIFWNKYGKWDVIYGILTRELTQAEYDALSDAEKLNGTIYYISDADADFIVATDTLYGFVKVDSAMSDTSENPVQNKVVFEAINKVLSDVEVIKSDYLTSKDLGGLSGEESDPTVPSWAKEPNKPSYTYSEVGADAEGSADGALRSANDYTDQKIADLINGAPTTLDTLKEIADAMEENQDVVDALNDSIGTKANASDLKTVAFSGSYNDLSDKPELHVHTNKEVLDGITSGKVSSWDAKATEAFVTNAIANAQLDGGDVDLSGYATKDELATKADKAELFSGSYNDLTNKPTIPTKTSQLTNDSGFKTTDNNTTYQLSKSGNTITLTGSDGSTTSVTDSDTETTIPEAGSSLGLVKTGGDVTISSGVITVNDDSHNHVISNVDNLQSALDAKVPTSRTVNGKALSSNISLSASDVGADASGSASTALTNAKSYTDTAVSTIQNKLDEKAPYVILTQEEYDALPSSKNSNNVVYFIK